MKGDGGTLARQNTEVPTTPDAVLAELRERILSAREEVARTIDSGLAALCWQVGCRVRAEILKDRRAEYGAPIVSAVGRPLELEFGRGFSENPLKRDFYAEMCRLERWSTRTLHKKIDSMLFERTALSRKPAKLAEQELRQLRDEDKLSPDLVFRDPYLLDFLGLKDTYAEKDLEAAILREMEACRFVGAERVPAALPGPVRVARTSTFCPARSSRGLWTRLRRAGQRG